MSSDELFMLPSQGKCIVDCYADWCGPCKRIAPYFEELKEKNPQVLFLKCDIQENGEFAKRYKIESIPAFITFVDGKETGRLVGADKVKLNELITSL